MRLSSLRRPFICLVVSEPTVDRVIGLIDSCEGGVDAFEINLTAMGVDSFRDIFSSTKRPCIATNRRAAFMRFYGYEDLQPITEESRARRLGAAAEAGASAVDCELDIFDEARQRAKPEYLSEAERTYAYDPKSEPAELSMTRSVVRRQVRFVGEIKDTGTEVILSCHTQTVITPRIGTTIISAIDKREGDFGKIVSLTPSAYDLPHFVDTVVHLKQTSKVPFNMMNVGEESVLGRLVSVKLGSSWVYCRPERGRTFSGQPTVRQVRDFLSATGIRARR